MTGNFTARDFWDAQGIRAIGSVIVTTEGTTGPAGFVALSATHLTADPPIMTIAVMPSTSALETIRETKAFAINYLAAGADTLLTRFMGRDALKGAARFEGLACTRLESGAPILPDIVGAIDCRVEDEVERFRTLLIFGRILTMVRFPEVQPLVHFAGGFLPKFSDPLDRPEG